MAAKKIEKLINEMEAYFTKDIEEIFVNNEKNKIAFAGVDADCENYVVNCFCCKETTIVPFKEHMEILQCPKCGSPIKRQVRSYAYMRDNYNLSVNIKAVYENDDCFALCLFKGAYAVVNSMLNIETPTLERFLYYEKSTEKLSHYTKVGSVVWSKQKPKREYYYRYGYSYDSYNKNIENEKSKAFFELPCFKDKCLSLNNSSFYDISLAYDVYIKSNPVALSKKSAPEMPDFDDFQELDMVKNCPKLYSFSKKMMGPITVYKCNHCGQETKTAEMYHRPRECSCIPDSSEYTELILIDSKLMEDGSIIIGFASSNIRSKQESDTYLIVPDKFSTLGYIYATKDKIYYYNDDKCPCNLSDFNANFMGLYMRRRYSYTVNIAFRTGEKTFKDNLNNSVLSKTGLLEVLESDKDMGYGFAFTKNINFIELYNKAPVFEQIAKLKMKNFMDDVCKKTSVPKIINKKETEASKIFGLTSYQLKQVRNANASLSQIEGYKKILENDPNALYDDCRLLLSSEYIFSNYDEIIGLNIPNLSSNTKKLNDYIQSLDDYQCIGIEEGIRIWIDYIKMSIELKCDLKDKSLVYTNSLKLSHDRAVKKYNNLKNKEIIKSFDDAISRYAHLSYENDDFLVRPPASQEELYEEGRKLNHCVGSYAKSVAEGRSVILFVRSKENPDVPFVTVELRNNVIVQAKGKYNVAATKYPGIKKFFEEWFEEKSLKLKYC